MHYWLSIAVGGALGALARFGLGGWLQRNLEHSWPYGTLFVNVVGSSLMGVMFVLVSERLALHPDWRGPLMVGFLGAFTTFSTFSLDTVLLFEAGRWLAALSYAALSLILCVAACAAGIFLTRTV